MLNKLLIATGILGLLAAGIGEVYNRVQSFSGELCVATGHEERIVVRKASEKWERTRNRLSRFFGDAIQVRKSALPAQIPFDDREAGARLLDPALTYDAARLPFPLRLKRIEIVRRLAPQNSLKVTGPGQERMIDIVAGGVVEIEGENFQVTRIDKWSGLLRDPEGMPMAAISLRSGQGPWGAPAFFRSGQWRSIGPNLAVCFTWFDTEAAAREAIARYLPGIETARWGVADGTAMNWFESFAPGTGAQLSDGTSVTLVRLEENHATDAGPVPAIEVEVAQDGQSRTQWVAANDPRADAPIRFDYAARNETVVLIDAYQEDAALVAIYHHKQCLGNAALSSGQECVPENSPVGARLDQVLAHAVPVKADNSPLYEAVLQSGPREVRARQGEAVRLGDSLIEFVRTDTPPVVRYELIASVDPAVGPKSVRTQNVGPKSVRTRNEGPGKERAFSIGPDDSVRLGGWYFSQGTPGPEPARTAVLRADFSPGRTWIRIVFALGLAVLVYGALHTRSEAPAS